MAARVRPERVLEWSGIRSENGFATQRVSVNEVPLQGCTAGDYKMPHQSRRGIVESLPYSDIALAETLQAQTYTPVLLDNKPVRVRYTFKITIQASSNRPARQD